MLAYLHNDKNIKLILYKSLYQQIMDRHIDKAEMDIHIFKIGQMDVHRGGDTL
jgi:hypothetical protein